ncbi:MAG: tyrosine-type recombinase/integrase [Bryobacteraceae bacterium]
MKQPEHPLQKALAARVRWLATTLQPATMHHYWRTVRLFLEYLKEFYPEISKPSQLRRDPHVLGWLEHLWKLRATTGRPLDSSTRGQYVARLRTLLDLLADGPHPPMAGLLRGQDIPPRQYRLPRPLTPEDDARLQQHWAGEKDVLHSALLLQRLTGMRIGECVDLAPDCLRHLGDNRWTLHVPHGKPRSERWVPVDDQVRVVVERLSFLRTLPPAGDPQFLLPRPKGRSALLSSLRKTLDNAAARIGMKAHIVPHQLRHTYATTMLRAGVSLPALMRLLGHHNANMTLLYVEVTQLDLQREYQAARLHPRHLMPLPPALQNAAGQPSPADALAVATALTSALRLLDLHRQLLAPSGTNKQFLLLSRRLARIRSLFEKLSQRPTDEK